MARRKIYSKTAEPLDQWLESQGFYRKHVARDGYSLFRAVSEQVKNHLFENWIILEVF